MNDILLCPNCGIEIEVSTALCTQVREKLRREFEAEARKKERELSSREETVLAKEQRLEASRLALEEEIEKRLAEQKPQVLLVAQTQAKASLTLEMQDLQAQLNESKKKVHEAQAAELLLRNDRRQLEAQKQELELTVSRTLDEERDKIREVAKREIQDANRLREAEQEKQVADLRQQIDELKRRSEKASPQARGEIMELELEDMLRDAFPSDSIEAVPVGAHGGDILEQVRDPTGLDCGRILWESKRTKNWSDGWLPKLRNDQRAAKAHLAVLTSEELPKGLGHFGCIDGVWVTSRHCLIGLAAALRQGLIEAARMKRSLQGRQDKVELLYTYLAGAEFRQRIEGIVEAFTTLKEDLESEKRSMHRLWAKREKQLERAARNTSGMYGDLAGILGASLPQIANLELAMITAEPEALLIGPANTDDSCF